MSLSSELGAAPGTPTGTRGPRRARQAGWYIPWLFVAFFGVVFVANGVMVWIATSTYTGLATDQYFIKGIRYNAALDGAREQRERGWKVDLAFQSQAERRGIVSLTLHDRYGNLLSGSTATVRFIRPTAQGHDFELALPYLGEGRYGTDLEFPLSGVWDLRLVIDHTSGDWQGEQRIWVK